MDIIFLRMQTIGCRQLMEDLHFISMKSCQKAGI